jgi:hypothetical protein
VTYTELANAIKSYTQNYESDFVTNIPTFVTQAETRIYNTVQIPSLRKNVNGFTTSGNKYLSCPTDFLAVFSMAVIDGNGNYEYLLNKDVNFLRAAYPNPTDEDIPKYYALFGPTVVSNTVIDELSFMLAPTPDDAYEIELHYYYYPESIIQSPITAFGAITGGSNYTNGSYFDVPLTGGSGTGALATIVVSGNTVTSVTLANGGSYYVVGDTLSVASTSIPSGSGFSIPVTAVTNSNGRSWLGDNYNPVLLYGSLVEAYTFMKGEQDVMAFYEKKYQDALAQLNRLGTGLERGDAYRDGQAKIKVNP